MVRGCSRISLLGKEGGLEYYQSAVSLHCHTRHSKEDLGFVPVYASRIPVLASFFDSGRKRYFRCSGRSMNFSGWYWTPPPTLRSLLNSEKRAIERRLDLYPLVSITDHDGVALLKDPGDPSQFQGLPLSLEWTVPCNPGCLHLGIHNLPRRNAAEMVEELKLFTRHPERGNLDDLLAMLNEYPETLVVLNHPMADLKNTGSGRPRKLVTETLSRYRGRIHALEINGYRPWGEALATFSLAEEFGIPVVSGGDRHGLTSNAVLNVTRASSFSEFVSEVRRDKISHVLLMSEFCRDLIQRKLESMADFFRFCPEFPRGLQGWTDRVFVQVGDGVVRPLSNFWESTVPVWVKSATWLLGLMQLRSIQRAVRMALARRMDGPSEEFVFESRAAV